jgi:fructoselysine-6-P-deglycase FrlB-like protein
MNKIMLEEIKAQSEYVDSCLPELRKTIKSLSLSGERIIMGGCGDSYFSAISVTSLFDKYGISFIAATAQEIEQFITLKPTDLVILASISGGTKRTVQAAEKARKSGARTVAITCNPEGNLAKISDDVVILPYQSISRNTPHTLDFIINLLANILIIENNSDDLINGIGKISKSIKKTISNEFDPLEKFVNRLSPESRFFFLGAGGDVGIAMYGAAKLHEAGGITAFHCETENFWHGFNFMIQPHDRVLVFNNSQEPPEVEQLLIENLSKLTDSVLYVGMDKIESPYHVEIPSEEETVTPFIHAVVTQILCYVTAKTLEYKVDDISSIDRISENHIRTQTSWFARKPINN